MTESSNVRVPPDSTGKRVRTNVELKLGYKNKVTDFEVGDRIIGQSSGVTGSVTEVVPDTPTSGHIHLVILPESNQVNTATDGESLNVDGSKKAEADGQGTPTHTQQVHLSGGNDPFNNARVDKEGGLFVRFTEGSQQLDSYGVSRSSRPRQVRDYKFKYDANNSHISSSTSGTASYSHLGDQRAVALNVDTNSGDKVVRTTDMYHTYKEGFGQLVHMGVTLGDDGKDGVVRRWGYYDNSDGLFFELDDSQNLIICIRSSTSGSVSETRIQQSNWNQDTLDGSGDANNLSGVNLDPSKSNLYWMDFQSPSAGTIRFGVYGRDGERITAHKFDEVNISNRSILREGALPLRWEIFNSSATGSPSQMKSLSAAVFNDGSISSRRSRKRSSVNTGKITVGDGSETALMGIRPSPTVNTFTNRLVIVPVEIAVHVGTEPIILRLRKDPTLSSSTWETVSAAEIADNPSLDTNSKGDLLFSEIFNPGGGNVNLRETFSRKENHLHLGADGSVKHFYVLTAECLTSASSTDVLTALDWEEA